MGRQARLPVKSCAVKHSTVFSEGVESILHLLDYYVLNAEDLLMVLRMSEFAPKTYMCV